MGSFVSYSIMSGIVLIPLYLIVKLLFNDSWSRLNRIIILVCYAVAIIVPALIIGTGHTSASIDIGQVSVFADFSPDINNGARDTHPADSWKYVRLAIVAIYFAGLAFFIIREIYSWVKLYPIVRDSRIIFISGNRKLALHSRKDMAPFSWYNYVVMSESDYAEDGDIIITHEIRHLDSHHWIDLMFAEIVSIFIWYNPAGWLMKEELQTVHEYEADEAVVKSGANVRQYQLLIIKKAVGGRLPSITNSLKQSNLSKRIKMMLRKDSSRSRMWRAIAVVPAVAIGAIVLNLDVVADNLHQLSDVKVTNYLPIVQGKDVAVVDTSKEEPLIIVDNATYKGGLESISPDNVESITVLKDSTATARYGDSGKNGVILITTKKDVSPASSGSDAGWEDIKVIGVSTQKKEMEQRGESGASNQIYDVVEEMPKYPGGEIAMMKFLMDNVKYPEEAMKNGVQGRVIVKFAISETGKISDAHVERSVSPELDAEAIRVVNAMPDFIPGKVAGKPVSTWYVLPVSFKLN